MENQGNGEGGYDGGFSEVKSRLGKAQTAFGRDKGNEEA